MQHRELGTEGLLAYHRHLQTSHDFEVWAEVLTMEQVLVSEVDILDGQINFSTSSDGPDRTGSLVLSDPDGALDYGNSFTVDEDNVLWVNRLVRVRHRVVVPSLGAVTTTVLVGCPISAERTGAEISMELVDKSILADHGVRPRSYKKGMDAAAAIRSILKDVCGEHFLRIPKPAKRVKLSKPYTIGMGEDSLTPWQCAQVIARNELGWHLYYSSDGYATAVHPKAKSYGVKVDHLLNLPSSGSSFNEFSNYAKVTSIRKLVNKKKVKGKVVTKSVTMNYNSVATLPKNHELSEQSLARNGKPRTLPIVVSDNNLKTQKKVNERAKLELLGGTGVDVERAYEILPFFHLDHRDYFTLPQGIGNVIFDEVSIPLGVGGAMSLGSIRWVSKPVKVKRVKSAARVVKRKKKKGGKKGG